MTRETLAREEKSERDNQKSWGQRVLATLPWILMLAIPLMLLLRGLARSLIVIPIMYAFWVGDLILTILPQPLFWILFLFLVLRIAFRSLLVSKISRPKSSSPEIRYPGRVEFWARRIKLTEQGNYSKWGFARHLGNLTLATLAYTERLEPEHIRERLQDDELALDPEVQAYLRAGLTARPPEAFGFLAGFRRRLFALISALIPPGWQLLQSNSASSLDFNPEGLVQYLENQLEVPNDKQRT
jgi:hypothetical protein